MAFAVNNSGFNGDVELVEAKTIKFEVQVGIAWDDDRVGCYKKL